MSGLDLFELAASRQDGLIDDQRWQQLLASHGEPLQQAWQQAEALRAATGELPRPAMPEALRATLAVPPTAAPAEANPSKAEQALPPGAVSGPGRTRPRWWWGLLPLAAAAGIMLWVKSTPESPPFSARDHTADAKRYETAALDKISGEELAALSEVQAGETAARRQFAGEAQQPAAAPRSRALDLDDPLQPETAVLRLADEHEQPLAVRWANPSAPSQAPAAAAERDAPLDRCKTESGVRFELPESEPVPQLEAAAVAGRLTSPAEAADADAALAASSPAEPIDEAHLQELQAAALAYRAKVKSPPPEELEAARQALALGLLADAADEEPVLGRSAVTASLTVAAELLAESETPTLLLVVLNDSPQALPRLPDDLRLSGLDAERGRVWSVPLVLDHAEAGLAPGAHRHWLLPLTGSLKPPERVDFLRIDATNGASEAFPYP